MLIRNRMWRTNASRSSLLKPRKVLKVLVRVLGPVHVSKRVQTLEDLKVLRQSRKVSGTIYGLGIEKKNQRTGRRTNGVANSDGVRRRYNLLTETDNICLWGLLSRTRLYPFYFCSERSPPKITRWFDQLTVVKKPLP